MLGPVSGGGENGTALPEATLNSAKAGRGSVTGWQQSPHDSGRNSNDDEGRQTVHVGVHNVSVPAESAAAPQTFCIHRSTLPVVLKPGSRPAVVDGFRLPAPQDLER